MKRFWSSLGVSQKKIFSGGFTKLRIGIFPSLLCPITLAIILIFCEHVHASWSKDETDRWPLPNGGPEKIIRTGQKESLASVYFNTLNIQKKELWIKGGSLSSDAVNLGTQHADGMVRMDGGSWKITESLIVGDHRNGTLRVHGGILETPLMFIGRERGARGHVLLSGGVVSTNNVLKVEGEAMLIFDGGTLRAQRNDVRFIDNFPSGQVVLEKKGGTIDTRGYEIRISASSGNLSGTGGLNVINSQPQTRGRLLLDGDNNIYSGPTVIGSHTTLVPVKEEALSPVSDLHLRGDAILDLNGHHQEIPQLSGSPGSVVHNQGEKSATLTIRTVSPARSPIFEGNIENGLGKLTLIKDGPGSQILAGSNAPSEGTIIRQGFLQIGNGGSTGSLSGLVNNHGHLVFNRAGTVVFSDLIQGDGTFSQEGNGLLLLTGKNLSEGLTIVKSGTLQIGNGQADAGVSGDIKNDGILIFDLVQNPVVNGVISGTGSVIQLGKNPLILNNYNTYLGNTEIRRGALTQAKKNAFSPHSNLWMHHGAVLDLGGFDGTIGSLLGAEKSIGSRIVNNGNSPATLTIGAHNAHGVYSGIIQDGTAVLALKKTGMGVQIFTGNHTYTGTTDIQAGELVVNARLASSGVFIRHGAILSGIGKTAGNVNNSGLLSPGKSIGTFEVGGDYIQNSDGKLLIQIAGGGFHDKLKVRGSAILGGTLQIERADGFVLSKNSEFTVLEAQEGIKNKFDKELLDQFPGVLKLEIFYESNKVKVVMIQGKFIGKTALQNSVGQALNEAIDTEKAQGELRDAIGVLNFIPVEHLGPYLAALSPTLASTIKEVLFNATNMQYGQLRDQLGAGGIDGISLNGLSQEPMMQQANEHEVRLYKKSGLVSVPIMVEKTSPWGIFANASGIFSKITTATDLPNQRALTGNFSVGSNYRVSQEFNAGVYAGYQGIKSWGAQGTWLKSNGIKFGLYSIGQCKGFYGNAMLGGGFNSLAMNRTVELGRQYWRMSSYPHVWELNSMLGGGYELPLGAWRVGVNTSLQYTYLGISSFTERGAGNLNIKLRRQTPGSLVNTLGGSISYHWEPAPRCIIIPKLGLSWQHEFLNYGENISAAFDNGVGPRFQLRSTTGSRNNAFGSAGFMAQLGTRLGGYCYYNPQFGGGDIVSHGILIGLNYHF